MQCPIGIEVAAEWVQMKRHKKDIVKFLWNQLKACVRPSRSQDQLTVDHHIVLKGDE